MIAGRLWREAALRATPGVLLWGIIFHTLLIPASAQPTNYRPESLFIALLGNGDALVEYDIKVEDPTQSAVVTLFASQDVRDLIAADSNDRIISFDMGQARNQIILNEPNATDVRISYSTQDLLNKTGKVWALSLDSPVGFTVKLPPESVLTGYSGTNSPSINTVGGQYLLTFDAGTGDINYVIGVVGTQEHASVLIKAADTTIREAQAQYQGIVLSDAESLLRNATTQLNAKNYASAEQLASQATDAALADGNAYSNAQSAISDADSQISTAASHGNDISNARSILQMARDEFSSGRYVDAKTSATNAVAAIGNATSQDFPISVIIASVVAAAGGVGAMLLIRMRQRAPSLSTPVDVSEGNSLPRPTAEIPKAEPQVEPGTAKADPSPFAPAHSLAGPYEESGILARIVNRILQEKPHLRPEDQQVLQFLAEKEGAAFESEIRGRFLLPKTTIWRLVKRLEREELVEIRKAGGQNLIKLRFEGRQP